MNLRIFALLCLVPLAGEAATYSVTSTADTGAAGTFRWAIAQANANPGSTITIQDNLGTITLVSQTPLITAAMTINGGTGNTVSGGGKVRIFFVDLPNYGDLFFVNNLTLANGYAKGGNGGAGSGGGGLGAGGAIFVNRGSVTVSGVQFVNNSAIGGAGGTSVNGTAGGGGGGLGGNGGDNGGGGGGYGGNGGNGRFGFGGGGGLIGAGGAGPANSGSYITGGGGGGLTNGADASPTAGGAGSGGGGNGVTANYFGYLAAQNGSLYGGGGGGAVYTGYTNQDGKAGNGGKFGGGGAAGRGVAAGDGGDFGGGGGNSGSGDIGGSAGDGGFGGGGGGGAATDLSGQIAPSGSGGFGGGAGGAYLANLRGTPGLMGGQGGAWNGGLGGGGGGGAAGGAIFVRSENGAYLAVVNSSFSGGTTSAGAGGVNNENVVRPTSGSAAGTGLFLNGGQTTLQVDNGTSVISDTISDAAFAGGSAAGLDKRGGGTLVLSASNTYVGGIVLYEGVVELGHSAALSSGVVEFRGGALRFTESNTVDYSSRIITDPGQAVLLDLNGQTVTFANNMAYSEGALHLINYGTLYLTAQNTYAGPTLIDGGSLIIGNGGTTGSLGTGSVINNAGLSFNRSDTYTVANSISGTGIVQKSVSGTLTFTGSNTYSGGTLLAAGKLVAGSATALPNGTSGADYALTSGTLDLNGYPLTMSRLSGGTYAAITLGSASLTVCQTADGSYGGQISGAGGLTKLGTSSLTIHGRVNLGGAFQPNEGTTILMSVLSSSLTSGIATVGTNATLNLTGSNAKWTSNADTLIGHNNSTGNLIIDSGATATDTFSLVGRSAGSTGHVTVTGAFSSWGHSAGLVIGVGGVGSMTVSDSASVNNGDGIIAGDAGSTGTVLVTGVNSTWLSRDSLLVGSNGAGTLSLDGGSVVQVGSTGTGTITLGGSGASSGILNIGGAAGQSPLSVGNIYASAIVGGAGSGTKLVNLNHNTTFAFAPSLTGNLSLLQSNGITSLGGSNTYTGGTTILGGTLMGTLRSGTSDATYQISGGELYVQNPLTMSQLSGTGGSVEMANASLTLDQDTSTGYAGSIIGNGSFIKQGSGTLTLAGSNTYSGGTLVLEGRLVMGSAGALPSGTLGADYRIDGGTLDLNGYAVTASSLTGTAGAISLGTASLTVQQDISTTFGGAISGTGGLAKSGVGTLELSGTNSLGGALSPNGGTMSITGNMTSGATSGIAATGGTATLNITGASARWTNTADILIGHNGGTGLLTINGGARAADTFALVGRTAGGTGNVTVTGAGSTWTHSAGLVIGTGGTGTMQVDNGGQVTNTDGTIGGDAGSSGTVRVTGSGSLWASSSYLVVGSAGAGTLAVDAGGIVRVGATGSGVLTLGNSGAGAGTLNIGAAVGDTPVAAGTVQAGTVTAASGSGAKTVNFNHTGSPHTFTANLAGNLNVAHYSGTTVLTGSNNHTGGTNVAGGTLTVNGTLTAAGLHISAGATVNCTSNGILMFNINGATAQQIVNGGTINLNGITLVVNQYGSGLTKSEYILVDASGGGTISGTFAGVSGAPGYSLRYTTSNQVKLIKGDGSYDSWAGGSGVAFDGDANGDGVSNGLAWLLGADNKDASASGNLPVVHRVGGNLVLSFTCLKLAVRDLASLKLQYSKDLGVSDPWSGHEVAVPDTAGSAGAVAFAVPSVHPDPTFVNLQATIPASAAGPGHSLYVRLMASKP